MDEFLHIKSIIGIVLGLSLTQLIKGSVPFIQHPERKKPYLVHFLWVIYVFLLVIHFWWWEFNLRLVTTWYFLDYVFIICYILLYYLLCAMLYPEDLKDYRGYKDYFYSRKAWFFGILAVCFLADVIDTHLKGTEYLASFATEYYVRLVSHVALCLFAIKVDNKRFHLGLVIFFILYEIFFIWRFYNLE